MKGITNYLLSIVFLLPAALLGQSTQVLQDLLQAQMLYPLSQKYIVVNASDTGQFRIKYDNQISFVTPFQALKWDAALIVKTTTDFVGQLLKVLNH